jgi:hypothetical protein
LILFRSASFRTTSILLQDPNIAPNPAEKNLNKTLVCPPNPHNITPIYASLMDFIGVIEKALKLDPG